MSNEDSTIDGGKSEDSARVEAAPRPSTFRALRSTPLRDLLRGNLSGRLDVERIIHDGAIPASLGDLVRKTTRRTRLGRREQAAVAEELTTHFVDGLAAGLTPNELIDAYGKPRQAARLIRRAKKRDRSMLWSAARSLVFGFWILVIAYVIAGLFLLANAPDPKVDYRVRLNAAALRVPEDDRAWPLYRDALAGLGPIPKFNSFNRPPRPAEIGWEKAALFLRENASSIARTREAASRPGLGFLLGYAPEPEDHALWPNLQYDATDTAAGSTINVTLPHLDSFRRLARTMALDTQQAAADGDGETVIADLAALLSMARHLREAPVFISDLVAYSIVQLALHVAGEVLADYPEILTPAQLRAMAHVFSESDVTLTPRFEGERLIFADIVQRVYTDDGDGDGRFAMAGFRSLYAMATQSTDDGGSRSLAPAALLPAVQAIMLSRKKIVDEHERLMMILESEAGRPLWEAEASRADRQVEAWKSSTIARIRHLPLTLLMPALSRNYLSAELISAERDAILVAIALVAHQRRHGAWPRSLEELVPGALPVWPPDRFDGAPLRFVLIDGNPLVYSVGTDRDDDGGRPAPGSGGGAHRYDAARRWVAKSAIDAARADAEIQAGGRLVLRLPGEAAPIPDGDWVLWPRPPEPIRRLDTF